MNDPPFHEESPVSDALSLNIAGIRLACHHCKSEKFHHRRAQLNTALATFFNFDWLNESADIYVCSKCGYLHYFLAPKVDEEIQCITCGKTIPAGATSCPDCGWSYQ